ncbi:MAG: hypothetical protein KA116_03640 [Proteobacteria bacterium]|nr:hypothetical protein [Pseudomonadota bacterium]
MKFHRFLSILFIAANFGFCGDKILGGGKALVCFSDETVLKEIFSENLKGTAQYGQLQESHIKKILFIETLDLYIAKLKNMRFKNWGKIFPIKETESAWDWIYRLRARFEGQLPFIKEIIPDHLKAFDKFSADYHGVAPVDDAKIEWVYELRNCTTVTVALQVHVGQFTELQIDLRLFDLMSKLSQSVLMLHEVMYWAQIKHFEIPKDQSMNSAPTRTLLGYLVQENLEAIPTVHALVDIIAKLGYGITQSKIDPELSWSNLDFSQIQAQIKIGLPTRGDDFIERWILEEVFSYSKLKEKYKHRKLWNEHFYNETPYKTSFWDFRDKFLKTLNEVTKSEALDPMSADALMTPKILEKVFTRIHEGFLYRYGDARGPIGGSLPFYQRDPGFNRYRQAYPLSEVQMKALLSLEPEFKKVLSSHSEKMQELKKRFKTRFQEFLLKQYPLNYWLAFGFSQAESEKRQKDYFEIIHSAWSECLFFEDTLIEVDYLLQHANRHMTQGDWERNIRDIQFHLLNVFQRKRSLNQWTEMEKAFSNTAPKEAPDQ